MSRIRTIKPDFWTSEQVVSCSPLARLLFIGLWNFCDDNGIHPASYMRLKMEVFPSESFNADTVKQCVNELINIRLLREYAVEKQFYWQVTGWKKHQRIDKPTFKFPLPQSQLKIIADESEIAQQVLGESSQNASGVVEDTSHIIPEPIVNLSYTDRKGMEENGKEKAIREAKASPRDDSGIKHFVNDVFEYWKDIMNHPRSKLDKTRENIIIKALKLGYELEELKKAIDGCAKTPFNMGDNDRNQPYNDIALILRDATHIDKFIGNFLNPPTTSIKSNGTKRDIMAGVGYE